LSGAAGRIQLQAEDLRRLSCLEWSKIRKRTHDIARKHDVDGNAAGEGTNSMKIIHAESRSSESNLFFEHIPENRRAALGILRQNMRRKRK